MNPATFLRVLGPERWRVCYVEPSVRPDDSRYGENPNRLQQHTQFQVRLPSLLIAHPGINVPHLLWPSAELLLNSHEQLLDTAMLSCPLLHPLPVTMCCCLLRWKWCCDDTLHRCAGPLF